MVASIAVANLASEVLQPPPYTNWAEAGAIPLYRTLRTRAG